MAESDSIIAITRKYLELRMTLIPYLYSAFWRYRREGLPPVRALALENQNDGRTHSIDDQYMLGDSLLVAPLIRGEKTRAVFLPCGEWYDFWTHERFAGGQTVTYDTPLEVIPVFVKAGAILPLADPVQYAGEDTVFDLRVFCFGKGEKCFTLYEDDGVSLKYKNEKYNKFILKQDVLGGFSAVRIGTETPRYIIREWKCVD
jgi:alpha-D-xyloside xylohydrolase